MMTRLPALLVGRGTLIAGLAVVLVVGCDSRAGAATPPGAIGDRLVVVATIGILADFARQVGGDRVDVHALVPDGADVHTFDPAPSDVARLSGARLLLMNGLGLDDWLRQLASDSGVPDANVVALAEDLEGVGYLPADGDESVNPHLWLDVSIAATYVQRIADALATADPAGRDAYDANAAAYRERLTALDATLAEQFEAVPADARRVVSFHDAFPYFAAAYDLQIVGVVVEAPGQEPSASDVAELVRAIREAGVTAILAEAQFSDALAATIAAETGAEVIRELYTDSLGDPPLDTYEAAMRSNAERIVEGLR